MFMKASTSCDPFPWRAAFFSLGRRQQRNRYAIDHRAVYREVLGGGLHVVGFSGDAVFRRVGRQTEHERTRFVRYAAINLLQTSIIQNAGQLHPHVGQASSAFIEYAAAEKSDRAFIDSEDQTIPKRSDLPRFHFKVLNRADT